MMSSFLLVSLNINATPSELALDRRRKELDEITKGGGLSDDYAVTLWGMKEQHEQDSIRSKPGMQVPCGCRIRSGHFLPGLCPS